MKLKPIVITAVFFALVGIAIWTSHKESNHVFLEKNSSFHPVNGNGLIGLKPGNIAPNFTLQNIDGHPLSLKGYRGKKVVVNFWATWCPPCQEEMPQMERFYKKDREKNLEILAINLSDTEKKQTAVKQFKDQAGITFPVLLDRSGNTSKRYQVFSIPTSYFIDSKGVIQLIHSGPMTETYMKQIMDKLN